MIRFKSINLLLLILVVISFSCKKQQKENIVIDPNEPTYYSVIDFAKDQWDTYKGQPFLITKVVTLNGTSDSVSVSAMNFKWSQIFKIFFETDISDPKYLGQYDFAIFEEELTQTKTFEYTAKDPKLFTQKFQVSVDQFTNKIRSIYIETQKENFWSKQSQKLFYAPLRVIQIQEESTPLLGSKKDLVVKCLFN
jgi:hypothetical protein